MQSIKLMKPCIKFWITLHITKYNTSLTETPSSILLKVIFEYNCWNKASEISFVLSLIHTSIAPKWSAVVKRRGKFKKERNKEGKSSWRSNTNQRKSWQAARRRCPNTPATLSNCDAVPGRSPGFSRSVGHRFLAPSSCLVPHSFHSGQLNANLTPGFRESENFNNPFFSNFRLFFFLSIALLRVTRASPMILMPRNVRTLAFHCWTMAQSLIFSVHP